MTNREKFEAWFDKKKQEMMGRGVPMVKIISICKLQWSAWQAALASQQPADDGWIEWTGGKPCPLESKDVFVEIMFRRGDEGKSYAMLDLIPWDKAHTGGAFDMIAYRVVKP